MQRILIPLVFVAAFSAEAQIKAELMMDGDSFQELQFSDSVALVQHVNRLQLSWINQGFYFAGIDSVQKKTSKVSVFLHKGNQLRARLPQYKGKGVYRYLSKQLRSYTNGGYPFASMRLDSLNTSSEMLEGKLLISPGPEISYDSAYFFSPPKTNHDYIYQLLEIVPGDPFSERDYRTITKKVERSSFLSIQRPADLSFKDNKAKVFLDIEENAANTFQGVLGLQQAQSGKTTAVGALSLDLQNLFRSGKQLKFEWESFAEESQNLSVYYKHPFFLDSKISPSLSFDLLKQDTTFLTRRTGLGIHTFVSPRVELFLEYEATNGTLLSSDLGTIENSGLADFKRKVYSIQASKGYTSSLGSLKNGVVWKMSASAGKKSIERNLSIPDSYYDSIQVESNFYRLEAMLTYQLKVKKRQAFYHSLTGGTLQNDELLRNELYRQGGLASLRGFNEKQFFAQHYVLSRMEFRSFFEDRSFAYLFYDQLIYQRANASDYPLGVGLGFALATSAGQFSFALAVGKSAEQEMSFSTMKAHFGYVSRF